MAKVIGYSAERYKKITCYSCKAIVEYSVDEPRPTGQTDLTLRR